MAVAKILQNVQFSDNYCPTVICWLLKGDLLHGDVCSVEAVSTMNEFCDHSYISEMKKRINFSHVKPFFFKFKLVKFFLLKLWTCQESGTHKQAHQQTESYSITNVPVL